MKLFWELGGNEYKIKAQIYFKLNSHMINEIRYIFKMRIGCDGSRETLYMRKLITQERIRCHICGMIESRRHLLEQCDLYQHHRRTLITKLNAIPDMRAFLQEHSIIEVCLYSSRFQQHLNKLEIETQQKTDRIIKEYIGTIRRARDC